MEIFQNKRWFHSLLGTTALNSFAQQISAQDIS